MVFNYLLGASTHGLHVDTACAYGIEQAPMWVVSIVSASRVVLYYRVCRSPSNVVTVHFLKPHVCIMCIA